MNTSLAQMPEGLLRIKETWNQIESSNSHLLLLLAGIIGILLLVMIGNRLRRPEQMEKKDTGPKPERLFQEILTALSLNDAEKKLLYELAVGTRLQHPTLVLLSPGLLGWAGKLWRQEKGIMVVTEEKWQQLENISVKLFDHTLPAE